MSIKFFRFSRIILFILVVLLIGVIVLFNYNTSVSPYVDDFVYELPYKVGMKSKVVQGYGGLFTHKYIAALDFRMPEGTPVYAARGGRVYSYRSDSEEGGLFARYKNKANYIIIRHDDGTYGCYWHLRKDGVLVKTGRVETGQQIGISGSTGQVLKPHLHFSVKRRLSYDKDSFVQTKFRTSRGILLLKSGEVYERPGN